METQHLLYDMGIGIFSQINEFMTKVIINKMASSTKVWNYFKRPADDIS